MSEPGRPHADVSVRIALPEDAEAIGAVQVSAWQERYAESLPADVLTQLEAGDFALAWEQAIARPREARQRILVALERNAVRGFAATAPGADADCDPGKDGEVVELAVHPDHRRQGHGSRLLHAVVDTLRADRFSLAVAWLTAGDDLTRAWLDNQGWGPDGAHRELDLRGDGQVRVKQIRLHTDLTEAS